MADNLALWSLPISILLAYVPVVARQSTLAKFGVFNNVNPRQAVEKAKTENKITKEAGHFLDRMNGAHFNSLETFPFWASAVLLVLLKAPEKTSQLNFAATIWLSSRVLHFVFYYFGTSKSVAGLRSLAWAGCLGACFYAFSLALL